MSNANNQTSTDGDDNPNSIGYGTVGLGRDVAKPASSSSGLGIDANHGFGVLGLAGNRSDTKTVADSLSLPTGPLEQPQVNAQTNILHLNGRLPEAGVCGISTHARGDIVGVLGYKNTGEPNGILAFLAGTDPRFTNHTGVYGESQQIGVMGSSNGNTGIGVFGIASQTGTHLKPETGGTGVLGSGYIGLRGETQTGVAVLGRVFGSGLAGRFEGDIEVSGDIRLVNQDLAEDFDVKDTLGLDPGSVVVFDADGKLTPCREPYDKKVAGVISGAGPLKPAIVLGKLPSLHLRLPIALLGKVYCKVDAEYGTVEVGDLLTPSPTLGHAMKAGDPLKAFGAVIGKALRPLDSGRSLIPILIALQ